MSTGSCYSCGTEFGIFKKEHGCKNCGFAFCGKCLNKKIEVPRLNNSRVSVCNRCFGIIKGDIKPDTVPHSPPLAYKKRIEALKSGAGKTTSSASSGHKKVSTTSVSLDSNKYRGMAKADIEIAQRLEKLREKNIVTKSETSEQLEDRLAALKGMDPSRYKESKKPVFRAADRKTQQEQVDDLLEEIAATVALDECLPDPDQAIRDQLKRLRQDETPNNLPEGRKYNTGPSTTSANTTNNNSSTTNSVTSGHPYLYATPTNSFDSQCSASSVDLNDFKLHGNNLNKTSCPFDKQYSYEKNINFYPEGYGFMDPVNINALVSEVKQVKEEVARNLKYTDSDNVTRAGDRKSWKNFEYEEAELEKEAEEIARRLTAEALREREEEEKCKQ